MDAKRDWGYAKDFVLGMWMMLQQETPKEYVLATNETHSVREFIEHSFNYVDMNIEWKGKGVDEIGVDAKSGKTLVTVNPKFFRPAEVDMLIGDYSEAKKDLGWEPTVKFNELVNIMMERDLQRVKEQ